MSYAYFAGGCFWCITPSFAALPGVCTVRSGYCGGQETSPTYEQVKSQQTGHRETVRVEYDPEKISFERLLDVFIENVDPFDGEGQFIDRGHSYTLAVYCQTDAEMNAARQRVVSLGNASGRDVFISIEPFSAFYDAEEYHQNFYISHPEEYHREMLESGRLKSGDEKENE